MPRDLPTVEQNHRNIVLVTFVIGRIIEDISHLKLETNGCASFIDDVVHIIAQTALRLGVECEPLHEKSCDKKQ